MTEEMKDDIESHQKKKKPVGWQKPVMVSSRMPGLRSVVWVMLITMIASSITLSVVTLLNLRIVRVLHCLEVRAWAFDEGFRDANSDIIITALTTQKIIPEAPAILREQLEEFDEYKNHRSRHRKKSFDLRKAIQKTDGEFRKYENAVKDLSAYLASLQDTVIDREELLYYRDPYNAARSDYLDSLYDGGKATRLALVIMADWELVLTLFFGIVLIVVLLVAAREARDSQDLAESSEALVDNLGVSAFVVKEKDEPVGKKKKMVVVDVSKVAVRVFGYESKDDLIGKPIDFLLPGITPESHDHQPSAADANNDEDDASSVGRASTASTDSSSALTSCCSERRSILLAPSPPKHRNTEGPLAIRGVTKDGRQIDLVRTITETSGRDGQDTTTIVCQDVTKLLAQAKDLEVAHKVHRQFAHELRSKHACASHELEAIRDCIFRHQDVCCGCPDILAKHGVTKESVAMAMTLLYEADVLIEGRLQLYKVFRGAYESEANVQIIDQQTLLRSRIDVVKALSAHDGAVDYRVATADGLADKFIKLDCYVFSHIANNLLSNARKHTFAGTVELSFVGECTAGELTHHLEYSSSSSPTTPLLLFAVKDTGRGIPEDIKVRLFKEEATSADVRGVGLGLMSCRVFAEAIGGACWLESTRTYLDTATPGTEFRFALPGCIVSPGALPIVNSDADLPRALRVLVVEDSAMLRRMIKAKFTAVAAAGNIVDLTVVEHPTVESILPHIHTFAADERTIVTVDQNLDSQGGVLKGSDLIPTLRKAGFQGLIISCSGDIEVAQEHLNLGADLVWGKPFPSTAMLIASLRTFYGDDQKIGHPSPQAPLRSLDDRSLDDSSGLSRTTSSPHLSSDIILSVRSLPGTPVGGGLNPDLIPRLGS